jgi:hypothetical protein
VPRHDSRRQRLENPWLRKPKSFRFSLTYNPEGVWDLRSRSNSFPGG